MTPHVTRSLLTALLCAAPLAAPSPASAADGDAARPGERWAAGGEARAPGNGACCLMEGCVETKDEDACGLLGGVFLPGASCASGACGVGACCTGMTCVETDAYTCLIGGREFAGAGTSCDDDPCEIGVGACCVDGVCSIVDEATCTGAGGVWFGPGTNCGAEPCTLGACCANDACFDAARFECEKAGGTFFAGAFCDEDPCASVKDCPAGTLFGQPRDGPGGFVAGTSERSAGFQRYENFRGVAGPIASITWYGLDLDHVGGNEFIECEEPDPTFEIGFHRDAGGVPGDLACFYKVSATRTPTGVSYAGAELNEYRVDLLEPCVIVNGWISIFGLGDAQCWFLWMSAPTGDGASYCDGCQPRHQSFDLNVCLEGEVGGVFGACCDDTDGTCVENVEISDCTAPGQRFAPNATCESFDPPCGVILGACCLPDATCSGQTEAECKEAGGNWLGSGSLCSACPCIAPCPPAGTPEGEPRCEAGYVDHYNGGCDAEPPVFSPIALGETVCGESGIFASGGDKRADFDWYQIEVAEPLLLTWSAYAEFQPRIWIVDGTEGCPGDVIVTTAALECEPLELAASVGAGTYWLVIAPAAFTDSAACGARYEATAGPAPPCPEDLDGSGAVDFGDILAILAAWGPCAAGCPQDLDGSGEVDFGDILAVLAAWGPCG